MHRKAKAAAPHGHGGMDAERQHQHQAQSEERQEYARQQAEELRYRDGGMLSPITYEVGSPSTATPTAPAKQKKKILFQEYQARRITEPPPREQNDQDLDDEEAEWQERMRKHEEELR